MNIFYLDHDPKIAAQLMCDQHINKMILEGAQLLSTVAHHYLPGKTAGLYKPTHLKHPCTLWLRECYDNCLWLYRHVEQLEEERGHRWQRESRHKSVDIAYKALEALHLSTDAKFRMTEQTEPAQAMPLECQDSTDPVAAYRRYYKAKDLDWYIYQDKRMTWTNRPRPSWMN